MADYVWAVNGVVLGQMRVAGSDADEIEALPSRSLQRLLDRGYVSLKADVPEIDLDAQASDAEVAVIEADIRADIDEAAGRLDDIDVLLDVVEGSSSPPVRVRALTDGGNKTSLTFTMGTAAPEGSLLLVTLNISLFPSARTVTPPAGWTERNMTSQNNDRMYVYTKVAGASEPTSYVFSVSGSAENHSGVLTEFSGGEFQSIVTQMTNSKTSPSITDTLGGGRVVTVFMTDSVPNGGITHPAGWTGAFASASGTFHGTAVGVKDVLCTLGDAVTETITTSQVVMFSASVLLKDRGVAPSNAISRKQDAATAATDAELAAAVAGKLKWVGNWLGDDYLAKYDLVDGVLPAAFVSSGSGATNIVTDAPAALSGLGVTKSVEVKTTANGQRDLTWTVVVPSGGARLKFYRRIWTERWDISRFLIDGVEQYRSATGDSNDTGWAQVSYVLAAGTRTMVWRQNKDGSADIGLDGQRFAYVELLSGSTAGAATAYVVGDVVRYRGVPWVCIAANTNVIPVVGGGFWAPLGDETYDARVTAKQDAATAATDAELAAAIAGVAAFKGAWDNATAYLSGQIVTYLSKVWGAIKANTNKTPGGAAETVASADGANSYIGGYAPNSDFVLSSTIVVTGISMRWAATSASQSRTVTILQGATTVATATATFAVSNGQLGTWTFDAPVTLTAGVTYTLQASISDYATNTSHTLTGITSYTGGGSFRAHFFLLGPTWIELVDNTLKSTVMGVVNHGAVAGTARPTGYGAIYWIGSVAPTNMADNDLWKDTSA